MDVVHSDRYAASLTNFKDAAFRDKSLYCGKTVPNTFANLKTNEEKDLYLNFVMNGLIRAFNYGQYDENKLASLEGALKPGVEFLRSHCDVNGQDDVCLHKNRYVNTASKLAERTKSSKNSKAIIGLLNTLK